LQDELEQDVARLWPMLLAIISDAEKRLAAHLATHNLTPPQFFVLKTLWEQGGRYPIGQIAHDHHLTNPTMTGLVKRLSQMDPPLVARERSTVDARSVDVVLTPAGEDRFRAVQEDLMAQVRFVLAMLDQADREDVIEKISHYVNLIIHLFPPTGDA